MPLLSEEDRKAIEDHFSSMERQVHITLTHPGADPGDSGAILAELAGLSGRISLSLIPSSGEAHPVISVGDHGRVLFWGTPSGYEFSTLLTAIIDAGRGQQRLSRETTEFLRSLTEPLEIMVFVTPTCPHCPGAAVLAQRMAAVSPLITARVIEAQEFPELAEAHGVMGVPRTVVNSRYHGEGNIPERQFVQALSKAMAAASPNGPVDLSEYMV